MGHTHTIAMYPGTFDPVTNGHLDVIRRAAKLFDKLIVAIGHNPEKEDLFSQSERSQLITRLTRDMAGDIDVQIYQGLTVDYAKRVEASAIVRGIRNVTDLNFEFQLALTNRAVADIETVFIMTGEQHAFTSSSLIKQIAAYGSTEGLDKLMPPDALALLKEKIPKLQERSKRKWVQNDALHDET